MRTLAILFALLLACSRKDAVVVTAQAPDPESCIGCHAQRQPGIMAQWNASAHAREEVLCEDCHGDDHEAIFRAEGRVGVNRCKECHTKETMAFKRSVHFRKNALKKDKKFFKKLEKKMKNSWSWSDAPTTTLTKA